MSPFGTRVDSEVEHLSRPPVLDPFSLTAATRLLAQGDEDTLAVLGHDPLLQPLLLRWVSVPALNQQEAGAGVWVSEVLDSYGTFSVNFSWRKETV